MCKKTMIATAAGALFFAMSGWAAGAEAVHKKNLPLMKQDGISWYGSEIGAGSRETIVKGFPPKVVLANQKGERMSNVEVKLEQAGVKECTMINAGP